MKTKFKRVLSIFLILCLTLTMMPGLTMVSLAEVHGENGYEFTVNWPGGSHGLTPDGREMWVTTGVHRETEWGKEYVGNYSIDVELTLRDGADADLLTYEIEDNGQDVIFKANNAGKIGNADVKISFYVEGEHVYDIESSIYVGDRIWHWPENLPGTNEDFYSNPEVGNIVDFSDIQVVEYEYQYDGGYCTDRVITANTPGYAFSMEYDEDNWQPVGDNEGLHAVKRVGTEHSGIQVKFEVTDEYGTTGVSTHYDVDSLDYNVYCEGDGIVAFADETSKEIRLNASALIDKMNAELEIKLGYFDDNEQFVVFENQSELFTTSKDSEYVIVTINPSQLAEMGYAGDKVALATKVTSGGYEVSYNYEGLNIKETFVSYDVFAPDQMILDSENYGSLEVEVYVENSEFPDGTFHCYQITDIEVLDGGEDVLSVEINTESGEACYFAKGLGFAKVKFTYEKEDGSEGEFVKDFEVCDKIYYIDSYIEGNSNVIIPGGLTKEIVIRVDKEEYNEEYKEGVDVDVDFSLGDDEYEGFITFTQDPDDNKLFTVAAKKGAPINEENPYLTIYCDIYEVDKNGNRVKDKDGKDVLITTVAHELRVEKSEYIIELDGFDSSAEVGESIVVTPKLKHAYLTEDGEYVEKYVVAESWNITSDSGENDAYVKIVDNNDGTYTIQRLVEWDFDIYADAVYDDCYCGINFSFKYVKYYADLSCKPDYIVEGKNTVVSIDEEMIGDKKYVTYEWEVGFYSRTGYVPLTEEDGFYTVLNDGKSIVLDGTKIYSLNTNSIDISLTTYADIDGEKKEMNYEMYCLDVYGADDELPVGDPDELTGEEFLGLADENGNIKLSNNVMLREPIVIADGKTYTVDLYGFEIYAPEQLDDGIIVTNGTIEFTSSKTYIPEEGSEEEYTANGVICADAINTIVIDGPIGQANVILDETMIVSGANPIVVKSGTLKSAAYINIWENEDIPSLNDGLTVVDKNKVDITLTGGSYNYDVSEYLADTHTLVVEAYVNQATEKLEVYYDVIEKGLSPLELMVERYVFFVDKDGNYYRAQEAADLLGVEVERIGYWAEIVYTDVNGEFNNDEVDYKYIHAEVGMTVKEAYEWYMGEKFEERTIPGTHFVGWFHIEDYDDIYWGDPLVDEDGDYVEDENGNMLWSKGNVINYGTDKIDINAPITKDLTIVTKWCDSTETKVVGKVEPTYLANGYTGDTVCAECGTLIKKGTTVEKLVPPVENGKVEVSEDVLDDAINESVTQESKEVVIPLGDATEEVKEVQLPVNSVETIIESGKDLTVETPEATVTLDNKALTAVAGNAEGETIVLKVETISETELNTQQQAAVEKFEVEKVISAEIICAETNEVISKDFEGGKATVKLPFVPADGENVANYKIAYIADNGTVTIIPTTYVSGYLVFEIEHFSEYAIVKEKPSIAGMNAVLEYNETTYDGTAKKPAVTVAGLTANDYKVTYSNNTNVGTATVTITGQGNYTGTIVKTFVIKEATIQFNPVNALFGTKDLVRIYGKDRFATAVELANNLKTTTQQGKFETIIVANGLNFADALAGTYLAKVKDAPIITVGGASTFANAKDYIKNNLAAGGKVYLLGGTGAVPQAFEDMLGSYDVERLAGNDRYGTNLEILREAGVTNEDILVCAGLGFADALSASAAGKPILLVGSALTADQKAYLKNEVSGNNYYIIGGTGAVSDKVANEIKTLKGKTPERLGGSNRYATAVLVAKEFFPNGAKTAVIAYGLNFPDGLSGGPLAMSLGAPLLLATTNMGDAEVVAQYAKTAGIEKAVVIGGNTLVSDAVANKIIGK